MRLEASRVSLPSAAATCALLDILPPVLASQYASPSPSLLRSGAAQASVRPVKLVAHGEYLALLRRMIDCNMLDFTTSPRAVNGLFAVPKGDDQQRLIVDARPANEAFVDSPHVSLPTPDLVGQLAVPSGVPLVCTSRTSIIA